MATPIDDPIVRHYDSEAVHYDRRWRAYLDATIEAVSQSLNLQGDERLLDGLAAIDGVTVHGSPKRRTPTVLMSVAGREHADVHRALAARRINAPAASFYALEASRHAGLGDTGGLRVGLAPYTNDDEIDRLLAALAEIAAGADA